MLIMGVFTASILYLLQRVKERTYRGDRAAFDRRFAMANAFGSFVGSAVGFVTVTTLHSPVAVAGLATAQTAITYGLFLFLRRKQPQRRRQRLTEVPPPCPWTDKGGRIPAVGARSARPFQPASEIPKKLAGTFLTAAA